MDQQDIAKLKRFIDVVKMHPALLHTKPLRFFRDYLFSLGATIPTVIDQPGTSWQERTTAPPSPPCFSEDIKEEIKEETESVESDVELDATGCINEDEDLYLDMGDPTKVDPSDDDLAKMEEARLMAQEAFSQGDLENSLRLWTDAIQANPTSATLFAKRAMVLLRMEKPRNTIKDASQAILLNPDHALAYRVRGRAHRLLGHWEDAAKDLNNSLNIDFSEDASNWLKEVQPNAKRIQDHKRKYERKRQEKELKEKTERIRKAKEERERAAEESASSPEEASSPDDFQGQFPGGKPPPGLTKLAELLMDPDLSSELEDPEVAAAVQDFTNNPANLSMYATNPKVMNLLQKLARRVAEESGVASPPPRSASGGDTMGCD